uniref:Uncharacterized protein n=1 Tax=Ditylenchus dipsaci TaxID=166011 RepID=A0A915EGS2_9BILA
MDVVEQLLEPLLNFHRKQGVRSVIVRLEVPVQQSVLTKYFAACGFTTGLPAYLKKKNEEIKKESWYSTVWNSFNYFKRNEKNPQDSEDLDDLQNILHVILNGPHPDNEQFPNFDNFNEIQCAKPPKH